MNQNNNILNTYKRMNISLDRGISATVFDDENNEYIDFTSGIGVTSVGHCNKKLINTIHRQTAKIIHTSNIFKIIPQDKLANRLNKLSTYKMSTFFCNSGAEANEGAIKIARKYGNDYFRKKKYKIITLTNSFHGRTITTLSATSQDSLKKNSFKPYTEGFICAQNINDIYHKIDDDTVAVMIELIQGEGGVYSFDIKEVKNLEIILKKRKILLIIDEVQTGVYRTGYFLASNLFGISPDIITLAKGLAGGIPIGAVMTNLTNIFCPNDHGSTFGGNHLSMESALTVLDILEEKKKQGDLDETILLFSKYLNEFYLDTKYLFNGTTGCGLMLGLKVNDNININDIIQKAATHGVLILKSGKNIIRFLPPLTITETEIIKGFSRLKLMAQEILSNN